MTDSGTSGLNKIISPPLPDADTASVTIDAHGGVDANESVQATAGEKGSAKKAVEGKGGMFFALPWWEKEFLATIALLVALSATLDSTCSSSEAAMGGSLHSSYDSALIAQ